MVLTDYSTIYVLAGAYIFFKIWNRLGGWPIAWYRLRGKDYFRAYIIQPNGKIKRIPFRIDKMEHHSPAHFTHDNGDYILPMRSEEKYADEYNSPAGLYNYDDSRPIPVYGREPIVNKDGDPDESGRALKVPPRTLHAGIKNDKIKQLNEVNKKPDTFRWGLMGFLIVLSVILSGIAVYYSYLYGINISCAVHTRLCP